MPLDDLRIDTKTIQDDFMKHLVSKDNDRIIFSAPFGTGKTTFLKELAEDQGLAIIHLAPVNYSVSPNEDIFRLIKYDIINELLVTHLQPLEFPKIDRLVAYGVTLPDTAPKLMRSFLSAFSSLNKDLPDTEKFFDLADKVQQFVAQTEQQRKDPNLNQRVFDFMNESEKLLPILENDFVTSFVQEGVAKLAVMPGVENEDQAEKKDIKRTTVLVIDDLDRLDPEHTFRLFNVFSAHLDSHNSPTNKFGFNKVIFACDIDNIRNIFHSRYGVDTDFSGYIDKFYSSEVFQFDIGELVAKKVIELLNSVRITPEQDGRKRDLFGNGASTVLSILLTEMVAIRAITLRRLMQRAGQAFPFRQRTLGFDRIRSEDYNIYIKGVIIIEALTWIAGSPHALEGALLKVRRWARSEHYSTKGHNERGLAEMFLVIATSHLHRFKENEQQMTEERNEIDPYTYKLPGGKEIVFSLETTDRGYPRFSTTIVTIDGSPVSNQSLPVFDLLYEAFLTLKTSGYLR